MQYKPYVLTLKPEAIDWIRKSAKEWKMKPTEFGRVLFDYMQQTDIQELKKTLQKAKFEAMLLEVRKQAEQATKQAQELEAKLEAINA